MQRAVSVKYLNKQRHLLHPIAKFRRYGRFPCKLVLNVLCFALLTAFTLGCEGWIAQNEESQRQSLIQLFMPSPYADPRVSYTRTPTTHFSRVSAFRAFLERTQATYSAIRSIETANYDFPAEGPQLNLEVSFRDSNPRVSPECSSSTTLSSDLSHFNLFHSWDAHSSLEWECEPRREFFGHLFTDHENRRFLPCRNASQNSVFDLVESGKMVINLRSVDSLDPVTQAVTTYFWSLDFYFDFNVNGLITISLASSSVMRRNATTVTPWMAVLMVLIIFSSWSFALRFRALLKILRLKQAAEAKRAALRDRQDSTSESSSTDCDNKLREQRFNKWRAQLQTSMGRSWTLWAMASDVLSAAYATEKLFGAFAFDESRSLRYIFSCIGGLAIFGNSVLFVSYLRFFPSVYALMFSINVAAPHLRRFIISVLPVFAGFAFFGNIVFGSYATRFATIEQSCTTLYAATFGDSLLDMFQATGYSTSVTELKQIGFLYTFAFISFFIWTVFNVATAIVLGSYSYVNETFRLYTFNIDRRATEKKTRKEQLEEAVEQAALSLNTIASLLADGRVQFSLEAERRSRAASTRCESSCTCSGTDEDSPAGLPNAGAPGLTHPWVDRHVIF
jgi:hypothetical protein